MTEKPISLRMADGSVTTATIRWEWDDESCRLHLAGSGVDEVATGTDYFESFVAIRNRLASRSITPLCYGASRNVWPSGMACDMARGLVAYKLRRGSQATELDMVNIFDSGPDVDAASPDEQEAFSRAWQGSLRAGGDVTGNHATMTRWLAFGFLLAAALIMSIWMQSQ